MVAFLARLDETLRRAVTIANERRHEQMMLDHLLLALTDDEDAAAVMRGCHVDIEQLRGRLDCSLADLPTRATADGEVKPKATLALTSAHNASEVQAVIHQAVTHVQSVEREVVTGAHVLIEILDRGPGSFLQEQGMTRYDAVSFLTYGSAEPLVPPALGEGENATALFRVLLLNDDYTPMEFVVRVLEQLFELDREAAIATMMHVHSHGIGVCGAYPYALAVTKVKEVADFAREHSHPLRCVLRPTDRRD